MPHVHGEWIQVYILSLQKLRPRSCCSSVSYIKVNSVAIINFFLRVYLLLKLPGCNIMQRCSWFLYPHRYHILIGRNHVLNGSSTFSFCITRYSLLWILIDSVCCTFFFLYEICECADILKYVIGIDVIRFKVFVGQQIENTLLSLTIVMPSH